MNAAPVAREALERSSSADLGRTARMREAELHFCSSARSLERLPRSRRGAPTLARRAAARSRSAAVDSPRGRRADDGLLSEQRRCGIAAMLLALAPHRGRACAQSGEELGRTVPESACRATIVQRATSPPPPIVMRGSAAHRAQLAGAFAAVAFLELARSCVHRSSITASARRAARCASRCRKRPAELSIAGFDPCRGQLRLPPLISRA